MVFDITYCTTSVRLVLQCVVCQPGSASSDKPASAGLLPRCRRCRRQSLHSSDNVIEGWLCIFCISVLLLVSTSCAQLWKPFISRVFLKLVDLPHTSIYMYVHHLPLYMYCTSTSIYIQYVLVFTCIYTTRYCQFMCTTIYVLDIY